MLNIFILIISSIPLLSLALNQQGAKFCNFPTPTSTNVTAEPLHITKDTDFGMQRIIFNGKPNTCQPNIPGWTNNWDHAIIVEDGITISNLIMGESPIGTSSDVICKGSCTFKNVFFENVCWRAGTFIGASNAKPGDTRKYTYIVDGGGALDGFQKIFATGGNGKTIVRNFCSYNNAIGVISAGECSKQYIYARGGNRQYNDKLSVRNVSIYGNNNPATQIKFVCDEYLGANTPAKDAWKFSYKPGEAGTSDVCCKYPASAVKIIN
uniref:Probable pectate lyase F n=1 Tax=Meloidogyne javanica TaxID=6303 RepID=A0A915MRD9_MELJA